MTFTRAIYGKAGTGLWSIRGDSGVSARRELVAVSGARLLSGGFSMERRDKSYKSEGAGCEQSSFCLVFLCFFCFFPSGVQLLYSVMLLLYSKVNQLHVYIYPSFSDFLPI